METLRVFKSVPIRRLSWAGQLSPNWVSNDLAFPSVLEVPSEPFTESKLEFNLSEWNSAFLLIVGAGITMVSGTLATKQAIASRTN